MCVGGGGRISKAYSHIHVVIGIRNVYDNIFNDKIATLKHFFQADFEELDKKRLKSSFG